MKTKICTKCGIEKPLIKGFSKDKSGKFGHSAECKACKARADKIYRERNKEKIAAIQKKYCQTHKAKRAEIARKWRAKNPQKDRNSKLKSAFGEGADKHYNKLFKEQNGCCAICGKHQSELTKALSFDHCHKTGQWRRLLCSNCNLGIGHFQHNPELCYKAFQYLKSFIVD